MCHKKLVGGLTLLSLLFTISCLHKNKTSEEKNISRQMIYPETDDLQYKDFVKALHLDEEKRTPAQQSTLDLPKDYKPNDFFYAIKEPSVLQQLEKMGFDLLSILESTQAESRLNSPLFNNELLQRSARYQTIAQTITQDLQELLEFEKTKLGKGVGVGIRYPYRVFDAGWLRSKISQFQLVGVVNRLDQVAREPQSCGEMRFIYRLGYDEGIKGIQSRLPMTLMVKFTLEGNGQTVQGFHQCHRFIKTWQYPSENLTAEQLVQWMTSETGPLKKEAYRPDLLKSVEINMQTLRIPSTMRPQFGGHGDYLLRVFQPESPSATAPLVEGTLENTPDVEKILSRPEMLKALQDLMKDRRVVNRIDAGIYNMPDEINGIKGFLARKAFSFSPMGLSRQDNRLFHKLLKDSDFKSEHFITNTYVKSPDAAIRRLNDLSCVGCHQGRATAGFHFLGIDRKEIHPFNALQFEGSGHFQLELVRRAKYWQDSLRKVLPNPRRDFSFAPPEGTKAGQGHFCGLPSVKDFAHWVCQDGLECMKVDGTQKDQALGKCFPKVLSAGSPCVLGLVSQDEHHKDALTGQAKLKCGDGRRRYGCSEVKGGFPSGMCNTPCSGLNSNEVCAQIAGATFTECVAKGRPFEECLDGSSFSGRGVCNDKIVCRNDYVCSRTHGSPEGNCTPAYFLFQIRLDGHPDPVL